MVKYGYTMVNGSDIEAQSPWFIEGYRKGRHFAVLEADYEELAAICRAGTIPIGWDLYRAEILNCYLGVEGFDFHAYVSGFVWACKKFYKRI